MHSNSVRILVKEKENKEREYVVSKKDAELSELLTGTINDYPDDPFVQLTDVEEKTIAIEKIIESKGVETTFEMNNGNHFAQPEERLSKAIKWLQK